MMPRRFNHSFLREKLALALLPLYGHWSPLSDLGATGLVLIIQKCSAASLFPSFLAVLFLEHVLDLYTEDKSDLVGFCSFLQVK